MFLKEAMVILYLILLNACPVVFGRFSRIVEQEEVDYVYNDEHEYHARFVRDYGENIGGPVAAATLPGAINITMKAKPKLLAIPVDCPALKNSDCHFDMKTHQVLLGEKKFLGVGACQDMAECHSRCDEMGCNFFTLSQTSSNLYYAYLYKVDPDVLSSASYKLSNTFDSVVKTCSTKRFKRQSPSPPSSSTTLSPVVKALPALASLSALGALAAIPPPVVPHGGAGPHPVVSPNQAPPGPSNQGPPVPPPPIKCGAMYKRYTRHHNRKYDTNHADEQHLGQFCDNVKKMERLNAKYKDPDDAKCGITRFSDMTQDEFEKLHQGERFDEKYAGEKFTLTNEEVAKLQAATEPSDLRNHGIVPPIRYQGSCGACYAFAVADLISIQNAMRHAQEPSKKTKTPTAKSSAKILSTQYILDCTPSDISFGCDGGKASQVLTSFIANNGFDGLPTESCYSYKTKKGVCPNDVPCCEKQKIEYAKALDVSGPHEKEIMAALLKRGPVLAVISSNEVWQFYNGTGIIKHYQCGQEPNHAVVIVGHDYSGRTPFYWVKNSWDTDWGYEGYAKLEAGASACGVAKTVVVACAQYCNDMAKDPKALVFKKSNRNIKT